MSKKKKPSKSYRRKRMANDFAKAHALRVAQAHREIDAIEAVCEALGPLTIFQRNKIFRMLEIAFEKEPTRRR